jgi:hypothetical protein
MVRATLGRVLGSSVALWFSLATGQFGLASGCWADQPPAEPTHAQHHPSAPHGDDSAPAHGDHAQHGNCLAHCVGVLGAAPGLRAGSTLIVATPHRVPDEPADRPLPRSVIDDLPFANGPPPPAA